MEVPVTPEPWLTAKIDQIAAEDDVILELLVKGDFYIAVDTDGTVTHHPRPEGNSEDATHQ